MADAVVVLHGIGQDSGLVELVTAEIKLRQNLEGRNLALRRAVTALDWPGRPKMSITLLFFISAMVSSPLLSEMPPVAVLLRLPWVRCGRSGIERPG